MDRGDSLTGRKIGAYQIVSRLGVGGMGEVYRASRSEAGARGRDQGPAAGIRGGCGTTGPV